MRLILKKEKRRPKTPKTATLETLKRFNEKLSEVEKYNNSVRAYNRQMIAEGERTIRRVSGFGKSGNGKKSKKR